MRNIVVIGGGPAGMMAAGTAAQNGNKVTIVEKKIWKELIHYGERKM